MPKNVRLFEFLIYGGGVFTIVTLPFRDIELTTPIIIANAIWWGFIVLLVWLTARRRKNWARWALFSLFLLEVTSLLVTMHYLQLTWQELFISVAVILTEGLAYYLVFTGDSHSWFADRAVKSAKI
jgi:hypothetical protein